MVLLKVPMKYQSQIVEHIAEGCQIEFDEGLIEKSREQFMKLIGGQKKIPGLSALLIGQDKIYIQNIDNYEKDQLLPYLILDDNAKKFDKQLCRISLFILINNLAQDSGISLKSLKELVEEFNNNSDLSIPVELNSLHFDGAASLALFRQMSYSVWDRVIVSNQMSISLATLLLNLHEAEDIMKQALLTTALSFEASNGVINAFTPLVNEVKMHDTQIYIAKQMHDLLTHQQRTSNLNELLKSITYNRLQDAYSLRCTPQVLGASLEQIQLIKVYLSEVNDRKSYQILENELIHTSADNNEQEALYLDFLCIAISEIGAISERRIQRLITPLLQRITQYPERLATLKQPYGLSILCNQAANLIQRNKKLASPTSADSMPQTTYLEDINIDFCSSIDKIGQIVNNTIKILDIDAYISTQVIFSIGPDELHMNLQEIVESIKDIYVFDIHKILLKLNPKIQSAAPDQTIANQEKFQNKKD